VRYLLDTTLRIDHALDQHGAAALVMRLFSEPNDLYVCDAVVAEATSKGGDLELAAIDRLIQALEYISTTPAAARWAGASRRRLGRHASRRLADALVAGVAWQADAVVVTRNPRDFESQGVPVLAYGQPPVP
jgi:predicted nucleic acid-binding protein